MATSFEKVRDQAQHEAEKGGKDQSKVLRNLDAKQRKALALFQKTRTAALLCQRWVEKGFLVTTDPAKKSRRYELGDPYAAIIDEID